jgi:hypothetical protein
VNLLPNRSGQPARPAVNTDADGLVIGVSVHGIHLTALLRRAPLRLLGRTWAAR